MLVAMSLEIFLVDRRHRAHLDELFDDVLRRDDHRGREFLHGEHVGNLDVLELRRLLCRGSIERAALFAIARLLEQQILLAILLRLVVAALAATAAATRSLSGSTTRRRRTGSAGGARRTWREGPRSRRRKRPEGTVGERTSRRRPGAPPGPPGRGGAAPAPTLRSRCARTGLIALTGHAGLTGARRNAGPAGDPVGRPGRGLKQPYLAEAAAASADASE